MFTKNEKVVCLRDGLYCKKGEKYKFIAPHPYSGSGAFKNKKGEVFISSISRFKSVEGVVTTPAEVACDTSSNHSTVKLGDIYNGEQELLPGDVLETGEKASNTGVQYEFKSCTELGYTSVFTHMSNGKVTELFTGKHVSKLSGAIFVKLSNLRRDVKVGDVFTGQNLINGDVLVFIKDNPLGKTDGHAKYIGEGYDDSYNESYGKFEISHDGVIDSFGYSYLKINQIDPGSRLYGAKFVTVACECSDKLKGAEKS